MEKIKENNPQFFWKKGYGVIKHNKKTQERIEKLATYLLQNKIINSSDFFYELLIAADHLTNAAMWLVVNQVYAKNIYLDGKKLSADDFKNDPQGHIGGSLNMVPAYVGYMLVNVLTNFTRGWVMGQGHCVAAIDSVNLLLNNMRESHGERYNVSDLGLTRFARDFYSYKLNDQGEQDSPLGSHVNPHTAGGHLEGGYLGFASLQYAHMPLVGERLVAFLSDGAFEEQRGSDWVSRWWRAEDCGLIAPIMILNGRRIDQRSTIAQEGGVRFFEKYLKLQGFDPIVFDGCDPAAFAWSIIEQEIRLQQASASLKSVQHYKITIPYGIAVAPKGAGFYNAGTNYAHNLPLVENPHNNNVAAKRFNVGAKKLFVPIDELKSAIKKFQNHPISGRALERDNSIANRDVSLKNLPEFIFKKPSQQNICPMDAIDDGFLSIVKANPHLRPRVGNPDEIRSNHMTNTLMELKFRVVDPEEGVEESTSGKIITALNEEAIAAAAFGNKGGINIIVTYEAFGAKIFGSARQEVIFSKHKKDLGQPAKWLSVPIILTSNVWESSKNELSHQDPSMGESMLAEATDISRVIFPADFNVALAVIKQVYQTQGQIWTIVIPKAKTPLFFSKEEAESLLQEGIIRINRIEHNSENAEIALIAVGAYQLIETFKTSKRLKEKNIAHLVFYIIEPGKFRGADKNIIEKIIPQNIKEIIIASHTRPEIMIGTLQPFWRHHNVRSFGFINRGGTLDTGGMLFVNKSSFVHILQHLETVVGSESNLLTEEENKVLNGEVSPDGIITKLKD